MTTLSATPVLTTDRLVLRAPLAADWPAWRDFALSPRSHFVRAAEITEGLAWRGFGQMIGHWVLRGFGTFIVTDRATGQPLGGVGPWYPVNWPETEIGWHIWTEGAEGGGLAAEAARATIAHAWGALGWTSMVSYIDPANLRSITLAERLGATLDPAAAQPYPEKPCLVYRHRLRGAMA